MRRSRETNNAPTDPRLRLAHRVKQQSATPSVPSTPLASTSSAATPLHGPAAGSASPLLDPLGIKRSSSVQSWADQRTLMKQEVRVSLVRAACVGRAKLGRLTCKGCAVTESDSRDRPQSGAAALSRHFLLAESTADPGTERSARSSSPATLGCESAFYSNSVRRNLAS